jgi:hypothetical protein
MTRIKTLGNAVFSNDDTHRYLLSRLWDERKPFVGFGMLNPSRAGAVFSDNTVSACTRMAIEWGFGGHLIVNHKSFVSTDPKGMKSAIDPTGGAANLAAWEFALGIVKQMVFAWGAGVDPDLAASLVRKTKIAGVSMMCLALTKDGHPHHPRGLPKGIVPQPFEARS